MKPTTSLLWQKLISAIHPPLPLNVHESRRLLFLLDKSFQKQINQSHYSIEDNAVDSHVHDLLQSPMLRGNPHPVKSTTFNPTAHIKFQDIKHGDIHQTMQKAIRGGSRQKDLVRKCLSHLIKESQRSTRPLEVLRSSKAAAYIEMWCSKLEELGTPLAFLADQRLTQLMIQVMVAAEQHHLVLSWLSTDEVTLANSGATNTPSWIQSHILLDLVRAELSYGGGTESALRRYHDLLGRMNAKEDSKSTWKRKRARVILGPTAHFLARHICAQVRAGRIASDEYDRLVDSTMIWSYEDTFERAWMSMHHPVHADPDPVVSYLRQLTRSNIASLPSHRKIGIVDMALRAAWLLMSQQRHDEVTFVMQVLQNNLSETIGVKLDMPKSSGKAERGVEAEETASVSEAANIQMLRQLAVG